MSFCQLQTHLTWMNDATEVIMLNYRGWVIDQRGADWYITKPLTRIEGIDHEDTFVTFGPVQTEADAAQEVDRAVDEAEDE